MNNFQTYLEKTKEFGEVTEIKYPLVTVVGLPQVKTREIVYFEDGSAGEVYSIGRDEVEIVVLSSEPVLIGEKVTRSGNFLTIPAGNSLLGKVINPLGEPYANLPEYHFNGDVIKKEVEQKPPGIPERESIRQSLHSGVMLVDLLLPLGKGQKQLVIGDRKTGKTSFILTLLKNQIKSGSYVIYGAIGRKQRDLKQLLEFIKKEELSEKIVVVASNSFDSPGLIYLTPFTAMSIAEFFRDAGRDVVVVFDDLSTHAKFYREISLVASRFPGRESYPGDIFYTHARIMERAGNFKMTKPNSETSSETLPKEMPQTKQVNEQPVPQEVSISALPVVETTEADLTSYIATNIMAMTDGHIFFDQGTFAKGRRPAINVGLSVTRVGRQAQTPLKRDINQKMMRLLSDYERLTNLAHFGAELSGKVQKTLALGETLYELLNQDTQTPIVEEVQLIMIALVWGGEIDKASIKELKERMIAAAKVESDFAYMKKLVEVATLYDLQVMVKKNKEELFNLIGMPIREIEEIEVSQKIMTLSDSIPTNRSQKLTSPESSKTTQNTPPLRSTTPGTPAAQPPTLPPATENPQPKIQEPSNNETQINNVASKVKNEAENKQ